MVVFTDAWSVSAHLLRISLVNQCTAGCSNLNRRIFGLTHSSTPKFKTVTGEVVYFEVSRVSFDSRHPLKTMFFLVTGEGVSTDLFHSILTRTTRVDPG